MPRCGSLLSAARRGPLQLAVNVSTWSRHAIRRTSHVRFLVTVASPNTATYFSRNCAGVIR